MADNQPDHFHSRLQGPSDQLCAANRIQDRLADLNSRLTLISRCTHGTEWSRSSFRAHARARSAHDRVKRLKYSFGYYLAATRWLKGVINTLPGTCITLARRTRATFLPCYPCMIHFYIPAKLAKFFRGPRFHATATTRCTVAPWVIVSVVAARIMKVVIDRSHSRLRLCLVVFPLLSWSGQRFDEKWNWKFWCIWNAGVIGLVVLERRDRQFRRASSRSITGDCIFYALVSKFVTLSANFCIVKIVSLFRRGISLGWVVV